MSIVNNIFQEKTNNKKEAFTETLLEADFP